MPLNPRRAELAYYRARIAHDALGFAHLWIAKTSDLFDPRSSEYADLLDCMEKIDEVMEKKFDRIVLLAHDAMPEDAQGRRRQWDGRAFWVRAGTSEARGGRQTVRGELGLDNSPVKTPPASEYGMDIDDLRKYSRIGRKDAARSKKNQ